ncbi:MAG: PIG-L family deacetylase [Bacteroidetes bacterium]|nr:PIG-L family deacetylase [Bacteroidota bacterium]
MHILVISPHPDDESIGCGGTIRQHILAGDVVEVIFLTSGEKGGHGRPAVETAQLREEEATTAGKHLGVSFVEFWRGTDGNFSVEEKYVQRLARKLTDTPTGLVYVPHEAEDHPDHRAAAMLVRQALLQLPTDLRPTVWMYEVWTPLQ